MTDALNLFAKILQQMNLLQAQHNKMLLDLYERIAKLEEKNEKG